jgi:flagellar hook-length control protein FliK
MLAMAQPAAILQKAEPLRAVAVNSPRVVAESPVVPATSKNVPTTEATQFQAASKAVPQKAAVVAQPLAANNLPPAETPTTPSQPAQPLTEQAAIPHAATTPVVAPQTVVPQSSVIEPVSTPTEKAQSPIAPASKPDIKQTNGTANSQPAAPTKTVDLASKPAAQRDTSQADPTMQNQPNASPLASRQRTKVNNVSAHTAESSDAPQVAMANSTPDSTQATSQDSIIAAATVKPLISAAPSDDAAPQPTTPAPTTLVTTSITNTHTSDNRANSAVPAQDSPRTESDQTFEQVILGLRTKVDASHTKAEISLNPPNLGTLHVSVSLQNGSVTAQFQSSSDVVRELLKGNMEKLKSVLESQGVTVDKLAVGAPQDKTELSNATPGTAQTNQSANDGRSAGQYQQDSQRRQRPQDPGAFAKAWQQANAKAPIDLVA